MPRIARLVLPGSPHHVTQRGTDRQIVFHTTCLLCLKMRIPSPFVCAAPTVATPSITTPVGAERAPLAEPILLLRSGRAPSLERRSLCGIEAGPSQSSVAILAYCLMPNPICSLSTVVNNGTDSSHLLDMAFWQQSGGTQNWQGLLRTSASEADIKRLRTVTYSGKPLDSKGFVKQAMAALATTVEEPITRIDPASASRLTEREYNEVFATSGQYSLSAIAEETRFCAKLQSVRFSLTSSSTSRHSPIHKYNKTSSSSI